jgi:hypothetical protein
MKPLTENQEIVRCFFESHKGKRFTREELCMRLFIGDRALRKIIGELRRHNPPTMIISYSSAAGYYLTDDEDVWDLQCKRQVRRLARGCFRRVKNYHKQLRMVS